MAQQTATEWLMLEMLKPDMYRIWPTLLERAKAMEKKQIVNAFENGIVAYDNPDRMNDDINFDAENYYKEIYGSNNQI